MRIKRSNFFASMVIDLLMFIIITAIAVIIVTIGVINYYVTYKTEYFVEPFADYEEEFLSLEYDKIDIEKILGKGSYFFVFDDTENLVFKSTHVKFPLSQEELELVPENMTGMDIEYTTHEGTDGLVHHIEYADENASSVFLAIISEDLDIIYSTEDLPNPLPKEGIELLTARYDAYNIIKYPYSSNGKNLTVVFFNYRKNETDFLNEFFLQALYILIIFCVVVLISTILYLIKLNRKVNKPLLLLKEAFDEYDLNEQKINYKGPKEFVEICERFNDMVKRLNETQAEKQQIIAGLSHDIRTPLTVIQTYAQALKDGIVPMDDHDDYLKSIYNRSDEMNQLVGILNDYSKLFHSKFELTCHEEDLSRLIDDYLSSRHLELQNKGFYLNINLEQDLVTNIDAFQFKRILDNLINNTIKYNDPGVSIYVSAYKDHQNIYINIGDDGKGIDQSIKDLVFQAFVTNDQARKTGQGTGLGLSIVRKLVEMHGGSINLIESNLSVDFLITFNIKKS